MNRREHPRACHFIVLRHVARWIGPLCKLFRCWGRANRFSASCVCEGVAPTCYLRWVVGSPLSPPGSSDDGLAVKEWRRASIRGELERKDHALDIQTNMSICRRAVVVRPCGSRSNLDVERRPSWEIRVLLGTKTCAKRLILRSRATSGLGYVRGCASYMGLGSCLHVPVK